MSRISVAEAKSHLSDLITRSAHGRERFAMYLFDAATLSH